MRDNRGVTRTSRDLTTHSPNPSPPASSLTAAGSVAWLITRSGAKNLQQLPGTTLESAADRPKQ
jgi:hypothetical protein